MPASPLPNLSPIEARVLGVLVEKQRTVPDTYPLTLNALASGCNQKTSRDPVMEVSDAQAQEALDSLKGMNLVVESSGGRVARYTHNTERVLQVPLPSVALLAVLMLRGPQTAGELRINCDRLYKFADISAVEGFLRELAARPAGALVAGAGAAAGLAGEPLGPSSIRGASTAGKPRRSILTCVPLCRGRRAGRAQGEGRRAGAECRRAQGSGGFPARRAGMSTHLIVQGAEVETTALKEIAKAVGASGIEQVRPNVFRLSDAKRAEGIAELCARHGLDWSFLDDPG